jgi:UDP-GlcNAc:undecaprenyl-phosphate/decaprenyl-phosphate GlcNAc-1-phosphate transferase
MKAPALLYISSFLAAGVTVVLMVPVWRRVCHRVGLVDDPGQRKIHAEAMPLAGGLAVVTGIIVGLIVALLTIRFFEPTAIGQSAQLGGKQLAVLIAGTLGMLIIGVIDDRCELRPASKFCGQFVIALAVALSGTRITHFVPSLFFSYVVTVLWILTAVNAFNFIDNMNGLCSGLTVIAAFLFGVSASLRDEFLVAALAFLCCGAFCGFLPYNFPRATAFLGDSGSHAAGFFIAVLAILPDYYSRQYPHTLSVLTPVLILAVPLVDLVTVVLIRWRSGKPFYIGDNNHLSHQLVRRGISPVSAVVYLWAAAFAFGALSLLL